MLPEQLNERIRVGLRLWLWLWLWCRRGLQFGSSFEDISIVTVERKGEEGEWIDGRRRDILLGVD
jgi:hypothetical protein